MAKDRKRSVQEEIRTKLMALEEHERVLLSKILRIERDNLHQKKPRIKDELLRAVHEVIK